MNTVGKIFDEYKLIAVIRSSSAEDAESRLKATLDGGFKIFEVSMHTPQAIKLIETYSKDQNILIGAGWVTGGEMAERVMKAGARFISTPFTNRDIITIAKNNDCQVIQGALTPTEVVEASELGSDFVKIYPVQSMGGVRYLKRIRQILTAPKLIAAGGVMLNDAFEYLKHCAAVCIGKDLFPKQPVRANNWNEVTERARILSSKVQAMKTTKPPSQPAAGLRQ